MLKDACLSRSMGAFADYRVCHAYNTSLRQIIKLIRVVEPDKPMFIPLISLLKLIALGSVKLIFLLLGIVFFPVFALRFILGGASSMLLPTLDWLEENQRLDADRHQAIVDDLDALTQMSFTRKESQHLLWQLIRKMVKNIGVSIRNSFNWAAAMAKKPFQ